MAFVMQKLIGNQRAYRTLAAWIGGGRLPHCVLIEGEPGTGRKTFARTLAQAILCEAEGRVRPCGVCRHCVKAEKDIHPDLETLQGTGGARSFHIDTVREMRGAAVVRPNEAAARIFLLLDTQDMSAQAQNALLKIIEEPPPRVHFILVCENRGQMLETIRSRAAILTMEPPGAEACGAYLREHMPEYARDATGMAIIAGGNIGRAMALLSDETAAGAYNDAERTLYALIAGDELTALECLFAFERDREGFLRSLSLMRAAAAGLMPGAPAGESGKPSVTPLRMAKIIDIINSVHEAARGNGSILLLTTAFCSRVREAVNH